MDGKRKPLGPSIPKQAIMIWNKRPLKKSIPALLQSAPPQGKPIKLFFADEAGFGRISRMSRCWVPADSRATVKQQLIREHTYAFTAVCPFSGDTYSIISPVCNTEAMNELLQALSKEYQEEYLVLIVDRAGWHRSQELKVPANISITLLPAYSPELNPTEHIWDYLREQKGFNNYCFASLEEVEDHLAEVLSQLQNEKQYLQSLCTFHWINNSS